MLTTDDQAAIPIADAGPVIYWGAIFAGLSVIVAGTILLTVLGAALGVSVVDVTDMGAVGDGLTAGVVIWVLLSALVVNFTGGLMAAHLSGRMAQASGLMHGVVVWALGFIAMVIFNAAIISGMVSAGANVTQGVASATSSIGAGLFSGVKGLGNGAEELASSSYTHDLRARIKREAAAVIANTEASGGTRVSRDEVRKAIENMDAELLERATQELVSGDTEGATVTLRRGLDLSAAEIDEIVAGVTTRIDRATENTDSLNAARGWLEDQLNAAIRAGSQLIGPEISRQELRDALQQLDVETTMEASRALLVGKPDEASNVLAANTALSESDIQAIVDNVSSSLEAEGEQILADFKASVEAVSDYAQAVVWLYFFTIALSLVAAALGGAIGASTMSRSAGHAPVRNVAS